MKSLRAAAAAAAVLFTAMSGAFLTEDELARLAEDYPPPTEKYMTNMRLVQNGATPGLNRTGWTAVADSHENGHLALNVLDSNTNTYWESKLTPSVTPMPHTITIDMKQNYYIAGVTYLPRQDSLNGSIGAHTILLSTDGNNFGSPKAFGTWHDDNELKTANFSVQQARYVRIQATSESGNRGPFSSAADISVYTVPSSTALDASSVGEFGPTVNFPTIMVAGAVNAGTGDVILWSSYQFDAFQPIVGVGETWTSLYNPSAATVSQRVVTNTGHDMFCPGLSRDAQGRPIVTGGNIAQKTSMYDPNSNSWNSLPNMNVPRGYQGQTTLSDGRIFTIGGSFSGGRFLKNGEVYSEATNQWHNLTGCKVKPMLTNDQQGLYRSDNHGWLMAWRNGSVFQAGPSKAMNWYGTQGNGGVQSAGSRGNDADAMNGNIAMYDATQGLMLAVGGSPNYDNSTATANAHIIQIGAPNTPATVTQINSMHHPRVFANSVVLPTGQVFIVGGQTYAVVFTDTNAVMVPELWDPTTKAFTPLPPLASPRTYHSTALLMPDGSVLIGGGGLCGNCSTNHYDAQVYYPPYFYSANGGSASRPAISSVSASTVAAGGTLTVNTNSAVNQITMMRYGSATHALDTDQRRVPLKIISQSGNSYKVQIPADTGIMIPGAWMLFALSNGVPSVSSAVMVTN